MPENVNGYSTSTALVYVFNLIVGTGALALPGAVFKAGWLPGTLLVCVLGLISYITVTFLIETLAVANSVGRQQSLQVQHTEEEEEEDEGRPLLNTEGAPLEIREKYEMLELATVLLSKPTRIVVFVCLVVYLFGDLSIYCAVIARTLAHTTCTRPENSSCNSTIPDTEPCWQSSALSRLDVYRLYIVAVVLCLGPLVFMDLQKTKWLQFITSSLRWGSFAIMVVWSVEKLAVNGPQGSPRIANFYALPTLFGTCVYSFMCHHSIPGLIQPISDKVKFTRVLPFNYLVVAFFYILLSLTAIWTFSKVEDLYTLNFWTDSCSDTRTSILFLDYFLALFPVFTLSTSFPIIAITLRNNLREYVPGNIGKVMLPVAACVIPASLALAVPNLQLLVGVVGSYAGVALQYVAPTLLVAAARSHCPPDIPNPFKSPFSSKIWIWLVQIWTVVSLILISVNYIYMIID